MVKYNPNVSFEIMQRNKGKEGNMPELREYLESCEDLQEQLDKMKSKKSEVENDYSRRGGRIK